MERILAIDTEDDEIANLGIPDIFGFDVNSFGDIYILRNIQGEGDFVFKFDSNGKFIKSFGPQGQGPGEFQNPRHIAIDNRDNILIYDSDPQILHRYDKDGILIGDYKMSGDEARISSGPNENLLAAVHTSESDKGRTLNTHTLKLINYYRSRMAGEDVPPVYKTILKHKDGSNIYVEINAGLIPYRGNPADFAIVKYLAKRK